MSSVTFWDGPHGLPAGLNIPTLFDDEAPKETDGYGDMGNGVEALPYPVEDDTYLESFDDDFKDNKGFGFVLAPGDGDFCSLPVHHFIYRSYAIVYHYFGHT